MLPTSFRKKKKKIRSTYIITIYSFHLMAVKRESLSIIFLKQRTTLKAGHHSIIQVKMHFCLSLQMQLREFQISRSKGSATCNIWRNEIKCTLLDLRGWWEKYFHVFESALGEPTAPRDSPMLPGGAQQTFLDEDKHLLYLNTRWSQSVNESKNKLGVYAYTATISIMGNYIPAIIMIIILMTKDYTLSKRKL